MKPHRLLFVITSSDTGGSESMLKELSLRIDRRRFEPLVCSLRPSGRIAEEIAAGGVEVFTLDLPEQPRLGDLLSGIRRLARVFDERQVDLVQALLYRANFISPLAARWSKRRPKVLTGHRSLAPLQGRMAVWTARLSQRLTDRAVANSEAVREHLVAHEGARREDVEVIYNGVDTSRFQGGERDAVRAELGLAPDELVAGAAGRFTPVKGYDHLLRGLARLERPLTFLLAGDGPERPRLEALAAELGIGDRVRFLGVRKDMPRLYAALDVFVLTSLREGFPNVVIEAMASGCAVVVTRVGGVPEIVEDGRSGLVIAPQSPEEVAAALDRLAADPELRRDLAAAGRRRVLERFDLARSVEAHETLYASLLA